MYACALRTIVRLGRFPIFLLLLQRRPVEEAEGHGQNEVTDERDFRRFSKHWQLDEELDDVRVHHESERPPRALVSERALVEAIARGGTRDVKSEQRVFGAHLADKPDDGQPIRDEQHCPSEGRARPSRAPTPSKSSHAPRRRSDRN